jgi:hypothetical protein
MGESRRDQQALMVIGREFLRMPAQESRGTAAQINDYVEYLAGKATDELGFDVRRVLKMHTANRALANRDRAVGLEDRD